MPTPRGIFPMGYKWVFVRKRNENNEVLIDVVTTYLYGSLDSEIYMKVPDGIDIPNEKKSLYGLKQSGRMWYNRLSEFLSLKGYTKNDDCPGMGFQRKIKILAKRTVQEAEAVTRPPHPAELPSLKTKRPRGEEEEEEGEAAAAASTPTGCGGGGGGAEGALRCPPAPKKARLVKGCSLDGFKVLSVLDLRFFLR
uniref:Reverse transcriptase Ty1/copia-type domain-containing protein n=1 Tax=Oryza brachyantha TaxID=4533 RepID=J3LCG2_ORYBR